MAQIEVGKKSEGKPSITGHLEFLDEYTGKTVSVEVRMRKHVFSSGKTGYLLFSGRVAKDEDSGLSFRLFGGNLGVYDTTKEYTPKPVEEEMTPESVETSESTTEANATKE